MTGILGSVLMPSWWSSNLSELPRLLVALCLATVLWKVISLWHRRVQLSKVLKPFPGPPTHWLFGNAHKFRLDGQDLPIVANWAKEYPSAFPVWMGNFSPFMFVTSAEYAKTVLGRPDPKGWFYRFALPWLGDGLLLQNGPKWQQHRRLLTPGFHYDVLKPYVKLISDSTNVMLDKWERTVPKGESFDVFRDVSLMTLDSIMKCAFSYRGNCQNESGNSFTRAIYSLCELTEDRIRSFFHHSDLIYMLSINGYNFRRACKLAHEHTDSVIKQRKETLKEVKELETIQKKRHLDFLDILLFARDESGKGLSDEDIRAEVDTFMFEGHDTTASGVSWVMYALALHPELQEKCREEVKDILGDRRVVEWDDLGKMTYTTMFIKESFRVFPPVPGVARTISKPITFSDGRTLPAGSLIWISIYAIHRDASVWENPEVFDPSRFSLDNSSHRHSHAFIPFVAGQRNCIGQTFAMNEMKAAIALILLRYEIAPDLKKPPIMIPQLVLRSKNGIHLYLKKIK